MKTENFRRDYIYNYVANNKSLNFYQIKRGLRKAGIKIGKNSLLKRLRLYGKEN